MSKSPARPSPATTAPAAEPGGAMHRSGAVARMLRMPVATLRVWARRYALTSAARSPSGQRMYSAEDVRRLALLKQLSDLGHAIGSLAALDMAQLQRVASTHAQTLAAAPAQRRGSPVAAPAGTAWRLVVVGQALGARLRRPALVRLLGRPLELLGPYADLADAAAALAARPDGGAADACLLHAPQLHAGWLDDIAAAAPALSSLPKAVLYGYAAEPVCATLAARGVVMLREPQADVVLAQWLRLWCGVGAGAASASDPAQLADTLPPRRWSDAALCDFAALSTTVACECPRHVAELLMQLSHFEAYSAQCEQRSPADAELHARLGRVAAEARVRFEAALEQVALHEGLILTA